jgi:ATP-dependent helicase/DNAse subunit B
MTERHFPQYHSENPIVGDEVLRRAGLDTAADHEAEEQFLFDVATTRATVETVLSYPRFTESGEPTLPSFFLQGRTGEECDVQVRPASAARTATAAATSPAIADPELLKRLAASHTTLSPTSIESFLQCSFQFFSNRTLRLRKRPPAPRDRLDLLLQGSILHRALNEWLQRRLLGATILDQVFEEECEKARVPSGYRKEAVRLELLRHFEAFLDDRQMQLRATSQRGEADFLLPLNDRLTIHGKIDRIDIDDQQRALVIDYKYSAGAKIRERIEDSASGQLVQSGLYLLAAKEVLDLHPLGMMFCGLKKGVNWDGWHLSAQGLDQVGRSCTPEALTDLMQKAKQSALQVHQHVLAGRIEPKPTEPTKCSWCDFRDICRIETIETPVELRVIGAGESLGDNA